MADPAGLSPNYSPVLPLVQYRGTDPLTGNPTFYRRDQNGVLVFRFNQITNLWDSFKTSGPFPIPNDLQPALSTTENQTLTNNLVNSGKFRAKTQYITIGDEPHDLSTSWGVVNFSSMLTLEQYANLKKMLKLMPRMYLKSWFNQNVLPSLRDVDPILYWQTKAQKDPIYGNISYKGNYDDLIWSAFIDVFNEANLEYVNSQQIEPWDWEDEKVQAYFLAANQDAADAVTDELNSYKELDLAKDARARDLMTQYGNLPPAGDPGLEISRQNAVRELIRQKEYDTVQGIIDAYRYAESTSIGTQIAKPIPFDIVDSETGKTVKATGG